MNENYIKNTISELSKLKQSIEQNWNDDLSKQYLLWIDLMEKRLKENDRDYEIIRLKLIKIKLLCENIIENSDIEDPKILTLYRK